MSLSGLCHRLINRTDLRSIDEIHCKSLSLFNQISFIWIEWKVNKIHYTDSKQLQDLGEFHCSHFLWFATQVYFLRWLNILNFWTVSKIKYYNQNASIFKGQDFSSSSHCPVLFDFFLHESEFDLNPFFCKKNYTLHEILLWRQRSWMLLNRTLSAKMTRKLLFGHLLKKYSSWLLRFILYQWVACSKGLKNYWAIWYF